MTTGPRFLNVDVDVTHSLSASQALRDHFRKVAIFVRDEENDFSFEAPEQYDDVDACIASLVEVICALYPDLATIWRGAQKRFFDVGYEHPPNLHSSVIDFSVESLLMISDIGAQLPITFYAACND